MCRKIGLALRFAIGRNNSLENDVNTTNGHMLTGIFLALLSYFIFAFVPNFAKLAADSGASLFFLLFLRFAIGVVVFMPILHWRKQSPYQLTKQQVYRIALSRNFLLVR